jgi:hypothetical protein
MSGCGELTLISTPPLDSSSGSEFVRINIDAALQQEDFDKDGKQRWKGRLDAIYLPGKGGTPAIEAEHRALLQMEPGQDVCPHYAARHRQVLGLANVPELPDPHR